MYPVPQLSDLAYYSGRPESSYTTYATAALTLATIEFTFKTEITDPSQLAGYDNITPADAATLALNGICALADWLYLRQPYQQAIANPMMTETIGSYTYSKPLQEMARNAAALEVQGESTGVPFFDLAVQMLSKRTLAGGVYSGAIAVFERPHDRDDRAQLKVCVDPCTGQLHVLGPADLNQIDFPVLDINGESFPGDPGISLGKCRKKFAVDRAAHLRRDRAVAGRHRHRRPGRHVPGRGEQDPAVGGSSGARPSITGMATYEVQWRMEIDGTSPQDAAVQAVTNFQERTDTVVTVEVRRQDGGEHGPWEPVEVSTGTGG